MLQTALFLVATWRCLQRRRSCATAYSCDNLSVNHGSVAIVDGANIALLPIDIADPLTMFEIICARARVSCFTVIVILLYRPGSQPLQQQQTFFNELIPLLERVKFEVAFIHRIELYCIAILCVISYRIQSYHIVLFSLRAISCQHYTTCHRFGGVAVDG